MERRLRDSAEEFMNKDLEIEARRDGNNPIIQVHPVENPVKVN